MSESRTRPVRLRSPDGFSEDTESFARESILNRLLAARGVNDPSEVDYSLSRMLPVGTLQHINEAVDLLQTHRSSRIVIVGDFDAELFFKRHDQLDQVE